MKKIIEEALSDTINTKYQSLIGDLTFTLERIKDIATTDGIGENLIKDIATQALNEKKEGGR